MPHSLLRDPCLRSAFPPVHLPCMLVWATYLKIFHAASSAQVHHTIMIKMPQNADKNVRNFALSHEAFTKQCFFLMPQSGFGLLFWGWWFLFVCFNVLIGSYLEEINIFIFTLSYFVEYPPNCDIYHSWMSFTVLKTKNNLRVFEREKWVAQFSCLSPPTVPALISGY